MCDVTEITIEINIYVLGGMSSQVYIDAVDSMHIVYPLRFYR